MSKDGSGRRNPTWAVLLTGWFGGVLALVAARLLPGQDHDRDDET
jgi:hypothetical protein